MDPIDPLLVENMAAGDVAAGDRRLPAVEEHDGDAGMNIEQRETNDGDNRDAFPDEFVQQSFHSKVLCNRSG